MPAKSSKLVIWGAGGHATVVADIVRLNGRHKIVAFVDDSPNGRTAQSLGAPIVREREALVEILRGGTGEMIIAIGDCAVRLHLASVAKEMGFRLASAIHPRATVASTAEIGAGVVIAAGAVVNPGAVLGENVIVNTSASVDHDCLLEDGVHICPGAHLAGNVTVRRGTWVGIGASVIEGVEIGKGSMIAAGGVVVSNMPDGVLAKGVPAKVFRRIESVTF